MTGEVSTARWAEAQAVESEYWRGLTLAELLRICAEKSLFLEALEPARLAALFEGKEVLEIGCGPLGLSVASFYTDKRAVRRLVKVEPLPRLALTEIAAAQVDWGRAMIDWTEALAREGEYLQRPGEALDLSESFDTAITYNVIDHTQDPLAILQNAYAALRPGGLILIGVDCFSVLGRMKFEHYTRRTQKGSIVVDAHPHSFLPGQVMALLEEAGYRNVECLNMPTLFRRLAGSAFRAAFFAAKPRS
jgi:SAM-dependent methyltransferase